MRHIKYVTDNPYRLLQISSCVTPRELRRAATRADRAVQVNQFAGAGLEQVFGSEEITHCPEIVGSLTNDAKIRTLYRLFWPFLYERPQDADDTLQDLNRLIDRYGAPENFHVVHLCFLKQWFEYLDQQTPTAARLAFSGFQDLYDDVACDEYLTELLQKEGAGEQFLYDAQNEVIAHLLDTVCRQSVEFWEAGNSKQAVDLLAVVFSSPFAEDAIYVALRPVGQAGDREMRKIRDLIKHYDGWTPDHGDDDIMDVEKLSRLSVSVGDGLAAAGLWQETVNERIEQVANSMRNYAIDLANNKEDWHGCRAILQQVQALPLSDTWTETLREDLQTLTANEKAAERQRLYDTIKPIETAPTLQTFNGIGTKMYGREPFDAEHGAYLSTLYFVVIFIPLFPIARYLVKDAPRGGWYFQGKAPWSLGNKIHLGISLALLIICIGWGNYMDKHPTSNYTAYSATTTSVTSVPAPPSSTPVAPVPAVVSHTDTQTPVPSLSMPVTPTPLTPVADTPKEYTPAPAPLSSSAPQPDDAYRTQQNKLRDEEKQLTERIHENDSKLSAVKADIEQTRTRLKATEQEIEQKRQNLQNAQADIDAERVILDHSDETALAAFNARVTQSNEDKTAFNAKVDQYNTDRQNFNDIVDAYNEAVRRSNVDVVRLKEVVHALETGKP